MPNLPRLNDGSLAAYTWPGGYPIYYICKDDDGRIFTACVDCARKVEERSDGVRVVDAALHWKEVDIFYSVEVNHLYCSKCGEPIECKYI